MSRAVSGNKVGLITGTQEREARTKRLERAPTGRNSIGLLYMLPGKKAGTPSDADYPATALPPIGTMVYDSTNSRIYVRHAVGVWKSVVVA